MNNQVKKLDDEQYEEALANLKAIYDDQDSRKSSSQS